MVTDINDFSTPSREKDQSSKANESSGAGKGEGNDEMGKEQLIKN